ncbi:MAG: zf-HC2 domain-containing protein [Gammaproteobacteria bacterium]|nr:zf-HC2 domain-containing protein [Gammaproteobacteria bacterium]
MLSCKDITQMASDYRDHHMGVWQRMQFRVHLMMCTHCRRFMYQLETTIGSISRITPVETDEKTVEDQVARLLAESRKK